jgi:hypothetical protein
MTGGAVRMFNHELKNTDGTVGDIMPNPFTKEVDNKVRQLINV